MQLETGSVCKASDLSADQGLRDENTRLRQMLKTADEAASRYSTLLREGNHRIKNSLQIVASLITMQARREPSLTARDALRTASSRIMSVARMHDALQESGGDDVVNLGEILNAMCASLNSMGGDSLGVAVVVEAQPIKAPVLYAQPIVLAVNELVVNALRHGFPDGRTGSITIKLWASRGQVHVLVADDGVGLPPGHAEGQGYGMKLVRMMTTQLSGDIHVFSGAGTRISLVFPEPEAISAPPVTPLPPVLNARRMSTTRFRKPWKADGRG